MGRPAEGWGVRWKRGWAYARFTWQGTNFCIALRTRDRREAQEAAARTYADVISGRLRPAERHDGKLYDLAELLDAWLESKRTSIDVAFFPTLEGYARRYVATFKSLDRITEANASTFGLARLGQGVRSTVLRELSYLRQFLAWCTLHGALTRTPVVPRLPPKAKGTRTGTQRKKAVHITPAEAAAIIALLPEESKTIDGRTWPIRARFAFMWETGLRPATLSALSVPGHWRPGAKHLDIPDEDDKARFGREVDLTPEAIAILRAVAPGAGLIFGGHVFSKALKAAATAVLGPLRGKSFAPYDFRHGRAKDLLDHGAPIRGVSFVLGHKRVSTTDKYLAPDRAAGREALAALENDPRTIHGPETILSSEGETK
jgi:integrase